MTTSVLVLAVLALLTVSAATLGYVVRRGSRPSTRDLALRAVFDTVADAVLLVDRDGTVLDANPAACLLLTSREDGELNGDTVGRAMELAGFGPDLPEPGATAEIRTDDGRHFEVEVREVRGQDGGPALARRVIVLHDHTEQRAQSEALREREEMLRGVLDRAPIGIVRLRPVRDESDKVRDFSMVLANSSTRTFLSHSGDDLVGNTLTRVRPPHTPLFIDTLRSVLKNRRPEELVMQVDRLDTGEPQWVRLTAVPLGDDISVTFVDITRERSRQIEMELVANRDPLTGLLNRRGLEQDAGLLLASALRDERPAGLLFIDLDDFKLVNDDLGHEAGDQLLRTFAQRLQDCVRAEDLVGRVGGDEFVVLVQEGDERRVREVADRVRAVGSRAYGVDGHSVTAPPSVGMAMLPRDGETLLELLRVADEEMYSRKASSRESGRP